MAETDAVLRISAIGGDEAAAALNKPIQGLNEIANGSKRLEEQFQHKFQHVGLQLFAGEALRASGVGMETRGVINILNLAMTSMGGAFGASIAPIMLAVSALVAVGGVIAKVVDHHKDLEAQLEKTNKATHDQLDKTNEALKSISDYEKEVGNVPPALKRWEESERSLQRAQVERQISGDRAQISSLSALLAQEQRRQEQIKEQISDEQKQLASLKAMQVGQEVLIAQAARLDGLTKAYKAGAMAVTEHKAKIDELIADLQLLGTHGSDDLKKLTEEHKKAAEEAKKQSDEEKKLSEKEAAEATSRYQHWAELGAKQEKEHERIQKSMEKTAITTLDHINTEQSNAFAKMIVKGESFKQATAHLWTNIAEQAIAEIERVIVKELVLYAVEQATGFGAISGPSAATLDFVHPHPQALGGDYMVNQPTLFMAGEAGPERATFTPLSQMGSGGGGGGGSIQIGSINTTVSGVQDPDKIADQVGMRIAERIRGQGEINFTRSF